MRILKMFGIVGLIVACFVLFSKTVAAQGTTATLSGTVTDESGASVPDVDVIVENLGTALRRQTRTGKEGSFTVPLLPPGRYLVTAQRHGFSPVEMRDVVLNVGDQITLTLRLKLAAVGQEVTVMAEPQRISTSPAVSTVIDRQFVENLPLNGRSFQSLLELTPGVVLTTAGAAQEGGQFSVNGQRANANYWMVDGVSANVGMSTGNGTAPGHSGSGQLPAMTALGGTNGLVSVDALQEFRIQTSTYAAEFGRMPGGQISLVSRSGTNVFHGSVFEYFRHEALDATDWFANWIGQPKAKLRQHNYGGVLGGPIRRNRLFFFGSFEGLNLEQPRAVSASVPSMEIRQTAAPAVRPYLDVFPIPNGRVLSPEFAAYNATYSDPSSLDATSIRLDQRATDRLTFFGRLSHAPSYSQTRSAQTIGNTTTERKDTTSVTAGSTWLLRSRIVNDLRVNYSTSTGEFITTPDDFGGGTPLPRSVFAAGRDPDNALFGVVYQFAAAWNWGTGNGLEQRQINIVDTFSVTSAAHEWKFGADYRRSNPRFSGGGSPIGVELLFFNVPGISQGIADRYSNVARPNKAHRVAFDNLSLYAQDNWRLHSRLTLLYGLRWEIAAPPHTTAGDDAITLDNVDDPYGGQVGVAPAGTDLFRTRYTNLAPRIGASYVLSQDPGRQLTIKGGFGIFHDLPYGLVANVYTGYPFVVDKTVLNAALPLTADVRTPPSPTTTPPAFISVIDRNIQLPRTYQWNMSVEQGLGAHQSLTVNFVGADGRLLLKNDTYRVALANPRTNAIPVTVGRNSGHSDYRGVQLQFQRRLHRGVQALASYSFGRSRDTGSRQLVGSTASDVMSIDVNYGYSDFDVRHVFSGALTYQTPALQGKSPWRILAANWGIDLLVRARSGFPVNPSVTVSFPPTTYLVRPNVVPGQPIWLDDPTVPGGRRLNRLAFVAPPPSTAGDLPRGSIRGFIARQVDVAFRRELPLRGRTRVQVRAELFNVLNTPNFGDPQTTLTSGTFGVTAQSLNRSLGGLNSMYQIGGPRSVQLAAKLVF